MIFVGKYNPEIKKRGEEVSGIRFLGFLSDEHLLEFMQGADKLMIVIQRNDRQIEILYDFGSRDDHIAMLNHALFHILSNQVLYDESWEDSLRHHIQYE